MWLKHIDHMFSHLDIMLNMSVFGKALNREIRF